MLCMIASLIAAGVLSFFGIKLLRENGQTDDPEKKGNAVLPIGMIVVAVFFIMVVVRTYASLSESP